MNTVSLARRSSLVGLAALVSVSLLATACSSSKKASASGNAGATTGSSTSVGGTATTSPRGSSTTGGTVVHVKDFAFNPGSVTVSVGSAVTWQFEDSISHNVTASNNAFTSNDLNNGQKFTFTFNKAGSYSYLCSIHPRMKATVVVK